MDHNQSTPSSGPSSARTSPPTETIENTRVIEPRLDAQKSEPAIQPASTAQNSPVQQEDLSAMSNNNAHPQPTTKSIGGRSTPPVVDHAMTPAHTPTSSFAQHAAYSGFEAFLNETDIATSMRGSMASAEANLTSRDPMSVSMAGFDHMSDSDMLMTTPMPASYDTNGVPMFTPTAPTFETGPGMLHTPASFNGPNMLMTPPLAPLHNGVNDLALGPLLEQYAALCPFLRSLAQTHPHYNAIIPGR